MHENGILFDQKKSSATTFTEYQTRVCWPMADYTESRCLWDNEHKSCFDYGIFRIILKSHFSDSNDFPTKLLFKPRGLIYTKFNAGNGNKRNEHLILIK